MYTVTFNDVKIFESASFQEAHRYFRQLAGRNYYPKLSQYTDYSYSTFTISDTRLTPQGHAWVTDTIAFRFKQQKETGVE